MQSTNYVDLEAVPEKVQATLDTLAANAAHLPRLLKASPYPASRATNSRKARRGKSGAAANQPTWGTFPEAKGGRTPGGETRMNPHVSYPVATRPPNLFHAALAPFPAVCFTLTLATDILYWQTANLMWLNFSSWLLFAGIVTGVLAAIAGIVDALLRRRRGYAGGWAHGLGSLLVLALAFVNSLVHAADGWTAIMPWGITLSAVTVLLVIVTAWLGRAAVEKEPHHA